MGTTESFSEAPSLARVFVKAAMAGKKSGSTLPDDELVVHQPGDVITPLSHQDGGPHLTDDAPHVGPVHGVHSLGSLRTA